MHRFYSRTTGLMMLSIGTVSALGTIFLIIFLLGYFQNIPSLNFFGPLNDFSSILDSILFACLATMLLPAYGRKLLWIHIPLLLMTWLGVMIVTVDSMVMGGFMSAITEAQLRIKFGLSLITEHDLHFGFGLIGIWLMVLIYHAHQNNLWKRGLTPFGFVTSTLIMIGILGAPSGIAVGILIPIWGIILGRWILSGEATEQ